MAKRPTQPTRPQPRDAKGRFTKRLPIPEDLITRLGEGRSALALWLDDTIPWQIVTRRKESR